MHIYYYYTKNEKYIRHVNVTVYYYSNHTADMSCIETGPEYHILCCKIKPLFGFHLKIILLQYIQIIRYTKKIRLFICFGKQFPSDSDSLHISILSTLITNIISAKNWSLKVKKKIYSYIEAWWKLAMIYVKIF